MLEMVERDQAVREQQRGIGHRGGMHGVAVAVSLELVAEVANEAAVEVEGQLVVERLQPGQLAAQVVEDRLVPDLGAAAPLDGDLRGGRVVAHQRAERACVGAHEREARPLVGDARAVEPERGPRPAEQVREHALGVRERVEAAHVQSQCGASGRDRRDPPVRGPGPSVARCAAPREIPEVGEQRVPVLGADRFRMELHPPLRPPAVTERHEHAVRRPGDRLERLRQRLADAQRVVAHRREALGDAGEELRAVVVHRAQPPVHHLRRGPHVASAAVREPLMPEADAKERHVRLADRVGAHSEVTRVLRAAGPGRDHDVVEVLARELGPAHGVVAHDHGIASVDLRQELEQVERERVVVVQQEGLDRAHDR